MLTFIILFIITNLTEMTFIITELNDTDGKIRCKIIEIILVPYGMNLLTSKVINLISYVELNRMFTAIQEKNISLSAS